MSTDAPGASTSTNDAGIGPCLSDAAMSTLPAPDPGTSFQGTWNQIPGLPPPAACAAYVAADPVASIGQIPWSACPSGHAGCQAFTANWGPPGAHALEFTSTEPVRVINGTAILNYERIVQDAKAPGKDDAYITTLQPIDQDPIFSIGSDIRTAVCAGTLSIGDDGVAAVIQPTIGTDAYIVASPWCSLAAIHAVHQTYAQLGLATTGFVQYHAEGDGHVFLELVSPNTLDVFDPLGGAVQYAGSPGRAYVGYPTSSPGGTFVFDYASPTGIGFAGWDGSYSILRKPVSGSDVTWYAVDHATSALVWVEGASSGNGISSSVIWTSPVATTPSGLQPRPVAALVDDSLGAGGYNMIANAGMALNVVGSGAALLTRLSDGMSLLISAEPGTVFVRPVWVDENEVWISTAGSQLPNPRSTQSGILRLQRSALGPATLPPGL